MLRHTFLLFFRNIKKHTYSFLINIIGLSAALTCVILISLWIKDEIHIDTFHKNEASIYHLLERSQRPSGINIGHTNSGHIGELLKEHMPEIEESVEVLKYPNDATLSVDDLIVKADGYYVSKEYFNVFSFPLLHGTTNTLWENTKSIVISESLAQKIFGTSNNVIGKSIEYQNKETYTVSGVFKDTPMQSSQQFDFVFSFEEEQAKHTYLRDWGSQSTHIFFKMKPNTDINAFNTKIENFIAVQTDNQRTNRKLFLAKHSEEYLYGNYENGVQTGGRITYVRLFGIIAIFILTIACINFMNLSTARASRRFKEIGIKKTAGASRKYLILQHLGESIATSSFAMCIAIIVTLLILPQFNSIIEKELILQFNGMQLTAIIGIALFTGLLAGSYPALYLSGFNPTEILKGRLPSLGNETQIRRGLIIVQYSISIILIVSVLVIYKQIEFIQTQNLGYSKDHIIHFDREGKTMDDKAIEAFLSELKDIPGVIDASSTRNKMVGQPWGVGGVQWSGMEPKDYAISFQNMIAYYGAIEMMDIELIAGRPFSKEFTQEHTKVLFNEAAIATMNLEDPVGKIVNFRGMDREIIGVVKDFHFDSFHESISPMIINMWPERLTKILVKLASGQEEETLSRISSFYSGYNPGFPFNYTFLDENYQQLYQAEKRVATLSQYFAGLAIIISCLGLFGLAAFTAERRKKEIGIRKTLGQSKTRIMVLLSSEFAKLVGISIIIGLPIAFLLSRNWLSGFAYKIELQLWYFLAAGVTALIVAMATVSTQAIRAANKNPIEALREE